MEMEEGVDQESVTSLMPVVRGSSVDEASATVNQSKFSLNNPT